jgi:hypothetical protein
MITALAAADARATASELQWSQENSFNGLNTIIRWQSPAGL